MEWNIRYSNSMVQLKTNKNDTKIYNIKPYYVTDFIEQIKTQDFYGIDRIKLGSAMLIAGEIKLPGEKKLIKRMETRLKNIDTSYDDFKNERTWFYTLGHYESLLELIKTYNSEIKRIINAKPISNDKDYVEKVMKNYRFDSWNKKYLGLYLGLRNEKIL